MPNSRIPQWDLSKVYPSLESNELYAALNCVKNQTKDLELFFIEKVSITDIHSSIAELSSVAGDAITRFNSLFELAGTVRAFIQSYVTTNSRDKIAMKKLSEFEQVSVTMQNLTTQFQAWIGKLAPVVDQIISANETTRSHAFWLKDLAEQSRFMMSKPEETLAAELNLCGANAWSKLQGTLTSQMSVDFEMNGDIKNLPMPALINLHSHADENVRRRAYEAEMTAWKTIEEPLAAAINGVKGAAVTLNKRRGREDAISAAIDMARIDRTTLEAMLSAMQDSFPAFRGYFQTKAKRIGKQKLDWWDIFAPVGKLNTIYSWDEAREFILINFAQFSPGLSAFAKRAFENNWIDAKQRDGKRGGAFCMGLAGVKESRILCNFDGTLDQVSTIAHELGHAFHNECAYKTGKTIIQQDTPMTLAETASIMCETIVMESLLKQTTDPNEQLSILETRLIGDAQVIVDIFSRYIFEKEVFERRAESELSPDDLCDIMERAQQLTYGDGVNKKFLMKYMWTWKPHYYYADLSFYNFPYAFGLLFATGLYAIYQQQGPSFIPDYINLLACTGENSAFDLAARFGINIREKKFWSDSLDIITQKIEIYNHL